MNIGIITYDYAHLKTEQLVNRYARDNRIDRIEIFGLPFKPRAERAVIIPHRPDMSKAVPTETLAELEGVSFRRWDGKEVIGSDLDFFVVGGAGILDVSFAKGKPIVNAHPGIIPQTRGLDAFKWAIFNGDEVGVTLHLIDNEVDSGELIAIEHTPVFSADSIETLARRHYELEIDLLSRIPEIIDKRIAKSGKIGNAKMRMKADLEAEMVRKFDDWKEKIIKKIKH